MATKGKRIKYRPCTNWGKSRVLVHKRRQYKLEEVTKWTNLGKFEEADKKRQLHELLLMLVDRAKEATITFSEGTVHTWDLSQKVIDEVASEIELVTENGKEVVERVVRLLREGLWVQEWGLDDLEKVDLTPFSPTSAKVTDGERITMK